MSLLFCDHEPGKVCPSKRKTTISGPGVLNKESSSLLKCCKVKQQIEALRKIRSGEGSII